MYLRAIFQVQTPEGLIFGRGDLTEGFYVTGLEGLYLEGLIHGGAYFRNFMVFNRVHHDYNAKIRLGKNTFEQVAKTRDEGARHTAD